MNFDETSPELCQAIVAEASEAVVYADREGVIRLWNRGAELLFGFTAGEAIGQSLDLIIPEGLRRAHWAGFNQSMETGHTKHGGRVLTTRSMHKNGDKLYVDLSFGLVRDATGAVTGAFAVGRDCTERHLADKASKQRLRELEERLEAASKPTP